MKRKNLLLWLFYLNKRLYKKYSFLLLLGMIPLLILSMSLAARQESGVLKILLYQENPQDELSGRIIADLLARNSLLQFVTGSSTENNYRAVASGEVDAAWIFPDRMQEKIDAFIARSGSKEGVITILEREDNVALQLSREVLYGSLYPSCSYALYRHFIANEFPETAGLHDDQLQQAYASSRMEVSLFQRTFIDQPASDDTGDMQVRESPDYLLAPLRGLLSLLIVLCGLASCLYYMQDEEKEVFTWLPSDGGFYFSVWYHIPSMLNTGVLVLPALYLTGSFTVWHRELLLMGFYLISVIGFCDLIRKIAGNMHRLGIAIPILILIMLAVCPIFFSGNQLRLLQYFLPPFYYLNALHNQTFVYYMLYYILAVYTVRFLLYQRHRTRYISARILHKHS